jgi:glycosyltransferase involved in cell wall biosynthesis
MCNAFVDNGIDLVLALPEPNIAIKNTTDYIQTRFGISLKFNLLFYKSVYKNPRLEKYFAYQPVKKLLLRSNAEYVFLRSPKFIKTVLDSGKKLIFESHNNLLHNKIRLIDKYWKRKILKYSMNEQFVLFICISHNLSKYWKNTGIPPLKLIGLHDGFSAEKYKTIMDKVIARNKLDICINEKIAMYVGSLYPDREVDNILFIAKQIPSITFYIIGGPEKYRSHYFKKANNMKLNNIRFIGHVTHDEVPTYLFAADILLALWSRKVPTINYCSPLKVFEYMASGQSIIAHNFVTIAEVLENKVDALLINPDNLESLYLALKNLSSKDSCSMGKSAREKAFKLFTWTHRAKILSERLVASSPFI